MGSRIRIPLEARFLPNLSGASLHRAFHVHPSIVSIWLKFCWKGRKTSNQSFSTRSTRPLFDPYSTNSRSTRFLFNLLSRSTRPLLDLTRAHSTTTRSFKKVVQIWQSLISCYELEEITSTTSRMSRKGRKAHPAAAFFNHEATTLSPPPSNTRPLYDQVGLVGSRSSRGWVGRVGIV